MNIINVTAIFFAASTALFAAAFVLSWLAHVQKGRRLKSLQASNTHKTEIIRLLRLDIQRNRKQYNAQRDRLVQRCITLGNKWIAEKRSNLRAQEELAKAMGLEPDVWAEEIFER